MRKQVRSAIYIRKSTEEGLEQDFNSLDAQREACSAFILSQRHEGWREMPEHFDDGGFSGGTMVRPALIRLLDAYIRPMNPMSLKEIAESEGIDTGDVSWSLQLAFLAPGAVRAILDGRQAPSLTATRLTRIGNLPLLWDAQIDALR